jgi:hypothetical protein
MQIFPVGGQEVLRSGPVGLGTIHDRPSTYEKDI